jgi:hypothetical protein
MPYIKLESVKDSLLGRMKAIEISGTDLVKNDTWTKKFFANNTKLRQALEDFEPGDEVNVVMEQDKRNPSFWNIVDIRNMTDDDRGKIEKKQSYAQRGTGGGGSVRRADGGSRGDDTNRSAAMYLAWEMVKACTKDVTSMFPEQVAVKTTQLASDILYPFLKDGMPLGGDDDLTVDPIPAPTAEPAAPKSKKFKLPEV